MNTGRRPRDILAANLRALMAKHPDLDSLPKITARCGVTNGTLDRIRRAVVDTRISELAPLAAAFGLQPWQLLAPDAGASSDAPWQWLIAEAEHRGDARTAEALRMFRGQWKHALDLWREAAELRALRGTERADTASRERTPA